jgi:hypothetical protein
MTTTPQPATPRLHEDGEAWTAAQLKKVANRVAADLADLADQIQRAADQIDLPRNSGPDTYAGRVAFINSRIMNALPNLQVGSLITLAATADVFAAEKGAKGDPS